MPNNLYAQLIEAAARTLVAECMQNIMPEEAGIREYWMQQPSTAVSRAHVRATLATILRVAGPNINWHEAADALHLTSTEILAFYEGVHTEIAQSARIEALAAQHIANLLYALLECADA